MSIQKSPYFLPSVIAITLIVGISATLLVTSQMSGNKDNGSKNTLIVTPKEGNDKNIGASNSVVNSVVNPASNPESNLLTYTESFLPNFKLAYPSDWKINVEDRKSTSVFPALPFKNITLTKAGYDIIVQITPFSGGGCGGGGYELESATKLPNKITKFVKSIPENKELNTSKITYVEYGDCQENGFIQSNLKASSDAGYTTFINDFLVNPALQNTIQNYIEPKFDQTLIPYTFFIRLAPTNSDAFIDASNSLIPEIDKIIGQSIFR